VEHSPYVSAHARLYLFADKWTIDGLKMLCLHQLHRDLCALDVKKHMDEILELINTTFQNTSNKDDNGPGVGQELRDLVVNFAAYMVHELIERPDLSVHLKEFIHKTFDRLANPREATGIC
jgi:hypothetical protein